MSKIEIRALIVEDDPAWQQILAEILEDMDLQVDSAGDLQAAEEYLRRHAYRLAVLDLSLGGQDHLNQDGLRAADAVRRRSPGCQILFLTGFATVELAVQVMREQGAFTCLRKEVFRRSAFRQVIEEALSQALQTKLEDGDPSAAHAPVETGVEGLGIAAPENLGSALVVEDDPGWNELLTEILADDGYAVQACRSYVEAIGLLKRGTFSLAVVDLSLASSLQEHNLDGYRLLSGMRKVNLPVIVVSGFAEPARIEQTYQEGLIYACLEKQSFDRKTFIEMARAARAGEASDLTALTAREREVLALLARGLTNKEIAQILMITPNTVKRHLKSLFAKLGVNTRSAASARAIRLGFSEHESL
jgi:DNA-binding NarL/FixJ family response regulator